MSDHEEKRKALELAILQIKKQVGEGAIMSLGEHGENRSFEIIQTGSLSLDAALGIGGFPKGRIVEIYGPESSGKSTLALHAVANSQRAGGLAVYIDVEHALDPSYAKRIGVDIEKLMISQPDSGEEALNIVEILVRSNAIDIIVIDSVAALVPKSELEGEVGDSFMGLQARMMSQALRKLTSSIARSNTCAIFINQIREKIGIVFGSPEVTTGGRALKFYSSVRVDIRRISSLKGQDNLEYGIRVKAKITKNKMSPPFRTAEFDILFNEGISAAGSVIEMALGLGIIEKKGSWLSYNGNKLGQGKEQSREELKKNDSLLTEIERLVISKMTGKSEPVLAS
ncbi:recombinase RecA [Candidatus Similichlamydia epinepheli]|uniref:recombinase RecA n=1 Tax=Candidatus Similichlamydia epinepheli TaxID=1903953 RepID=UPI000D3AEAA8|nr:recombinase RecA [Candidatus Similichlamydia epinepheli]